MFVNIGFGNFINSSQIVGDNLPVTAIVQDLLLSVWSARPEAKEVQLMRHREEKQNQSFLLEAVIWFSQRSHQRRLPPDVI